METEALEEMEMDTKLVEILVTALHLKEDIQEKIIKMRQNLLKNTMILQEKLLPTVIRFCLKTTCNTQNIFPEFLVHRKVLETKLKK